MRDYEWLFDTSGYYTYLLLDGSSHLFETMQERLGEAGFLISQSGRSFRPAGNGRQYDWYIRLRASDDDYFRIQRILNESSQQRYTLRPTISDYTTEKPAPVDEDEDTFTLTGQQIKEFIQLCRDGYVLADELEDEKRLGAMLSKELEETRILLGREKQKVKELEKSAQGEKSEWEQLLFDVNTELEQKLKERNKEITGLENQLAQETHDRRVLLEQVNQPNRIHKNTSKNTGFELFDRTLKLFTPDLEFLGGSIQSLWQEIENPIPLLEEISRLDQPGSKGERVEGLNGWLKTNKDKWRLYYTVHSESGKRRIFIGDKTSQKKDIEWLKLQ